uniref:Uncharacterized protein n=1 Tax=Acrobeloides nanus TaxID=290746 RepID=A0A914EEB5_9BILA
MAALTQMSHVCKVVGPQNWKFKNTKAEFEEIEAEDLNKIGLKIIKEAGKERYPVTSKMTVALLEIGNHIPYEQYGIAVLIFEKPEDFDHNANKALTQMSHVSRWLVHKTGKARTWKQNSRKLKLRNWILRRLD